MRDRIKSLGSSGGPCQMHTNIVRSNFGTECQLNKNWVCTCKQLLQKQTALAFINFTVNWPVF